MIPRNRLGLAAAVAALLFATASSAEEAATPPSTGEASAGLGSAPAKGSHPVDDAVLATLKNAQPMAVPKLPQAGLSAWRAAPHPHQAKNFGTVRKALGGDGAVSTTPPSEEIEKAVQEESTLTPPNRSGAPAFQGKPESAPVSLSSQVEKKVFGPDERVRIHQTNAYPFSAIGFLQTKFPGDGDMRHLCSGTLIGPNVVLTAAHCIYDVERQLWPEEVLFFPGLNGDNAPFGYYEAKYVDVLQGYADAPTRDYDWAHVQYDMGIVTLGANAGTDLGTLGFAYKDSLPAFVANIVGYPADMPLGTMWRATCDIDTVRGYPTVFEDECDTFQGSSGSSIYQVEDGTGYRMVYGVNVAETENYNMGLRISSPYYTWIAEHLPQ